MKQMKRALLEKLDEKVWLSDLHYIATFLCPETKSLSVSSYLIVIFLPTICFRVYQKQKEILFIEACDLF